MSTPSQSYQGPERRIDPDNRLSLDFHAPRALARFEDITPPEARRDAIATAKFREGDVMRDRLLRFVNRLDGRLSPEQQEFLDTTSEQYDTGFSAWKSTFQISDKDLMTLASKDAVMQWAATVQPETLQGLRQYGEPRLKLLPDMPVSKLMQIMDQHPTVAGQTNGYIGWDQWKKIAAPAGSFGLTADIEDMPFDATIFYQDAAQKVKRTNEQMVAEYKRRFEQTPGATIMPQHAYVGSAMDAMARGQKYDKQFWTAFERPQGAGDLPYAGWSSGRVDLNRVNPDVSYDNLRGRVWVPGEKV